MRENPGRTVTHCDDGTCGVCAGCVRALTLPWSCLAHDNHRLMPARGRLITSARYRTAKTTAEMLLRAQWRGAPMDGPVQLLGRVYFPDKRKRDAGNYRKLITDALSEIAYLDDQQVHRETWERAGIDRENPRVELTLSPL